VKHHQIVVLLVFVAISAPELVFANDGPTLINQETVIAQGGFPYPIRSHGSYKLSGNLVVPLNSNAIEVTDQNVTLDLNGFSITAAADGGTRGWGVISSDAQDTVVKNGSIMRMPSGIMIQSGRVEGVRVVASTKGDGISCSENCIIQDSLTNHNLGFGIKCGSDCIIRNNVVSFNVGGGINITSLGGVITENSLRSNQGIGISCTYGGTISGNAVSATASNGQPGQMGIGISAEAALVIGNTVTGSASYGLRAPNTTTGYSHNVFTKNIGGEGGAQVSGGLNLGSNFCSGALCP
jgi:hypothetical protein